MRTPLDGALEVGLGEKKGERYKGVSKGFEGSRFRGWDSGSESYLFWFELGCSASNRINFRWRLSKDVLEQETETGRRAS